MTLSFRSPAKIRRAAWVALIALLLQTFVPLIHHPAQAAPLPVRHICSQTSQSSKDGSSTSHKAPTCPVCQSLHLLNTGFVPSQAPVMVLVGSAGELTRLEDVAFEFRKNVLSEARPRAPPVLA